MDIDFDMLFREKKNFITEFEKYSDKLFKIIAKNVRDRDGKQLIENIINGQNDISQSKYISRLSIIIIYKYTC